MPTINCLSGIASYPLGCRESSGLADVWGSPWSASTTYSYDADGVITGATNAGTYYNFPQRLETAEFHPGQGKFDSNNGTAYYEQTLNLVLHKYQASLRNLIYTLGRAEMSFIVQSQNGKYFLVGEENGCLLTESDASLGKAFGDLNGTTLHFLSKATSPAREISSTFFSTLNIA